MAMSLLATSTRPIKPKTCPCPMIDCRPPPPRAAAAGTGGTGARSGAGAGAGAAAAADLVGNRRIICKVSAYADGRRRPYFIIGRSDDNAAAAACV